MKLISCFLKKHCTRVNRAANATTIIDLFRVYHPVIFALQIKATFLK